MLNTYALAPGHNNVAGLIPLSELIDGNPTHSHASSLGTFRAAREFVALDEIAYDDGTDVWEWTFAALLPSDIEYIETNILNGARSGYVTVETRNRYNVFVERNAVLTLPAIFTRPDASWKFGPVVFTFTGGRATS